MGGKVIDSLKDLNLSHNELERLTSAMKQDEFRQLLFDYVDEMQNPENRKLYQSEITQLEKERGIDVTFINPEPGYVIKTSVDGAKKCFINISTNEVIKQPSSMPCLVKGTRNMQWSLPHSLAPPRKDYDKKGLKCLVFDVVFHPDTLKLANGNNEFRKMINSTACEAVESNFGHKIDKQNMKFPKISYKGIPQPAVIRKPNGMTTKPSENPDEQKIFDRLYDSLPKVDEYPKKVEKSSVNNVSRVSTYTTPKYSIKHRSNVDMEEFTNDKSAKMCSTIPKELVIIINLPLLKSATGIELDVTEKILQLQSEKPAKYKLSITLPYQVNHDSGNAKFDKDLKELIITLPVKRNSVKWHQSFDVEESDHVIMSESKELISALDEIKTDNQFLDHDKVYTVPEYVCYFDKCSLNFVLTVKNVSGSSFRKKISADKSNLHICFSSISSGYYQIFYGLYIKFLDNFIEKVSAQISDNNLLLQIHLTDTDNVTCIQYLLGLDENTTELNTINTNDDSNVDL